MTTDIFEVMPRAEIEASLAEITPKLQSSLSVVQYGADPTGTNDSTQAFQTAVNTARTTMINNNFQNGVIVVIPAGVYTISGQVIISPFVHIKTQGFVMIQSGVTGKSTIWFTNQSGDPNFTNLMDRQQYLRSPLINAKDGGMYIKSTLNKQAGTIGLEIGSQSDLGSGLNLGRYSVCDVAIGQYDIALQMNAFNNYIAVFDNLHLETNNTNVRYGTSTAVGGSNRGENISFRNGVFANSVTCFDWYIAGMDTNFEECSFDFNTTLFNFRRGYTNVSVFGGHIEGNTVIADATASTVDSSSIPTLSIFAPVLLNNSTANTYPLFKGNLSLLMAKPKLETSQNTFSSFLYMCDSNVQAKEIGHVIQGGSDIAVSPQLNKIANSKFQSANLGSGDAAMPVNEFTVASGGFTAPVITATIPTGSSYTRALKAVSNAASGNWLTITTSNGYQCKGGDSIQMGAVIYQQVAALRAVQLQVTFYDILGNSISSSANYANTSNAAINAWQTYFGTNNITAPAGTATVKMVCTIYGLITNEIAYVGELFLGVS